MNKKYNNLRAATYTADFSQRGGAKGLLPPGLDGVHYNNVLMMYKRSKTIKSRH